jgi:hypothetical protein
MNPNNMHRDVINKVRMLADYNVGAASIITGSGKDLPAVIEQLEKYNVKGKKIWCIFKDMCDGDQSKTISFIINMKEPLNGFCRAGHNWGPSRSSKRTQCFGPACEAEATKFCSNCYTTRYCSIKCQVAGWKDGHNKRCKRNIANIDAAVEKMGVKEASKKLYILGLLSERGIVQYMNKYHIW